MKYLAAIGNCIASILLYPVWISWRNHEGKELLKAALRCDGGGNVPPPMKYWQHDETGRITTGALSPGERWYEITKGHYEVTAEVMRKEIFGK